MSEPNLEVVALGRLIPDPANLRKHGARNLEAIQNSLRAFGQQIPIVVDADNKILAGNGRYEAAKALGWTDLLVVRTDLRGASAVAFAIADNRTAELAEWDSPALAAQLKALQEEDFPLADVGYLPEEADKLLDLLDGSGAPEVGDGCGDEPPTNDELFNTQVKVGEYVFAVEREAFLAWQEDLRQRVGFSPDAVEREVLIRLGLKPL